MFRRLAILALLLTSVAQAQDAPTVTARTEQAIARGLDYLAKQQHADGYWTEVVGRKVNDEYQGLPGRNVGVTALAGMALLRGGGRDENVKRAVSWTLDRMEPDGFIAADGSNMYGHAFATLFLAEATGVTRSVLESAVDRLVKSQNSQGGWRYLREPTDADLSVSAPCLMALAAARRAGVAVPEETIARGIAYLKSSAVREYPNPQMIGGFWYQIFDQQFRHSRVSFALTAAGVAALYAVGENDPPEARAGLKFLAFKTNWRPPAWHMHRSFDYFYAHYYAIQAFHHAGGEYWARWYPDIADEIVNGQHRDGYWQDLVGRNYATAMATLILQTR